MSQSRRNYAKCTLHKTKGVADYARHFNETKIAAVNGEVESIFDNDDYPLDYVCKMSCTHTRYRLLVA